MAYLEPEEYAAFGLSAETSDAWVAAASSMMEAFCRRSSLLLTNYTERLRLRRGSGTVQLTYGPAQQVIDLRARYAAAPNEVAADGLLFCALQFGLPGQWIELDPETAMLDGPSGELQLQGNVLGLPYSEIEVTYTAGVDSVPASVKFACAQIVKNAQATPGLNVRASKLDTLQTEYFSDSLLDSQVRALLRPFLAERVG